MESVLLTLNEVCELCGCGISTVRRGWYAGTFPKPIRIGRRGLRWRRDDVEKWLTNRPALNPPTKKVETV